MIRTWTLPAFYVLGAALIAAPVYAQTDAEKAAQSAAETNKQPKVEQATSVASITADRGIVTRPGRFTLEPSLSYAHSTSTSVAIEGYTVIPALVIGLINIAEVQRDTFVGAMSLKYGFTSRWEAAVRVPYLSITEDIRERDVFSGTPVDNLQESSGNGLGDIEVSTRYQLNDGVEGWPYIIGEFRVKGPTGQSAYDVGRKELYTDDGKLIGVVLKERPTGSGFWSVEPGFSFIYPTDPAVLFGSLSYVWTLKEEQGFANGGTVDPGDMVRFGFGMGFSFNERTSFSLGYDHTVIGQTSFEHGNNQFDAIFDRIQVGSLSFGLAQRLSNSTTLSLSVSVGVTDNAPNSEITLKLPISL